MNAYTKADELAVRLLMLNANLEREDALVMWAGDDLLEACRRVVREYQTSSNMADAILLCVQAITKAEGRS